MTTPDIQATARLPWDAADPYPFYEACRREGDVVWDKTISAWLVLGYHPARQILAGPGWTSNPLANPTPRPPCAQWIQTSCAAIYCSLTARTIGGCAAPFATSSLAPSSRASGPTVLSPRKPLRSLVFDTGEAATVRRHNAR
jgi:hypothetical protein